MVISVSKQVNRTSVTKHKVLDLAKMRFLITELQDLTSTSQDFGLCLRAIMLQPTEEMTAWYFSNPTFNYYKDPLHSTNYKERVALSEK